MTRIEGEPGEIDQNFQIVDAIREALRLNATAEVSSTTIEHGFDALNEEDEIISSTLQEKCMTIAKTLGADFSVVGDNVVFRKK